jgi:hypothetical protein
LPNQSTFCFVEIGDITMTTWTYNTVIEGAVEQPFFPGSSGLTFQRPGQLVISDDLLDPNGITSGVNEANFIEVGLTSNDLPGLQVANGLGGITFVTNNALFATRDSRDNVFEGIDPESGALIIQLDRSNSQGSINNFSSGALSSPVQILDGFMGLQFGEQSVAGTINFSGTASSIYSANFYGELVSVV